MKTVALLAEDNHADVLLVQEAIELHSVPIDLHIVNDGDQAVKFIERADTDPEAPCPELLILDLNLPKRDGQEVLHRVRASGKCRDIPVLILTSSQLSKDRDELSKLGANRYFRKPSSYDQFMKVGEVVKEILKELQSRIAG
jgi:CheY-like chemotaxis protein